MTATTKQGGPIGAKPVIPAGKRYWIAVAWLWPTGDSTIVRRSWYEPPTLEPAPKAIACCWTRGRQSDADKAWEHMERMHAGAKREGAEPLYWAVYVAATKAELFGRGRQNTLGKVRERMIQEWKELGAS